MLHGGRIYKEQGCIFYDVVINISYMEEDSHDIDSNLMFDGVIGKMNETLGKNLFWCNYQ